MKNQNPSPLKSISSDSSSPHTTLHIYLFAFYLLSLNSTNVIHPDFFEISQESPSRNQLTCPVTSLEDQEFSFPFENDEKCLLVKLIYPDPFSPTTSF